MQDVQRERCQFGWRTDVEAGHKCAKYRRLERKATITVGITLVTIDGVEPQVDGFESEQLVNARKQTGQLFDSVSSN